MRVNGIDLSTKYDSKKLLFGQQTVNDREISSFLQWPDYYDIPIGTSERPKEKYFPIDLEFVVRADSKTEAEMIISNLLSDLSHGQYELDNMDFIYEGEISSYNKTFVNSWDYILNITINAWTKSGQLKTESVGTVSSKIINNPGNQVTPCIIELMPDNSITTFTIKGVARDPVSNSDEDIIIKNLVSGQKVIVDGLTGTITQNGENKFQDADFWEFPTLLPGNNSLSFQSSGATCNVTIKYYPKYF